MAHNLLFWRRNLHEMKQDPRMIPQESNIFDAGWSRRISHWAGFVTALEVGVVLLGSAVESEILKRIVPGLVP